MSQSSLAPQPCGKLLCSSAPPFTDKCSAGSRPALCPDIQGFYPRLLLLLVPICFSHSCSGLSLSKSWRWACSTYSLWDQEKAGYKKPEDGNKNNKFEYKLISPFPLWGKITKLRTQMSDQLSSLFIDSNAVLLCQDWYNKTRQAEWLELLALEAGSSRSMCQPGWFLLRPLFLACRWPPSPCVLTWSFLRVCVPGVCVCPNLLF